jgi:hypothetical protein
MEGKGTWSTLRINQKFFNRLQVHFGGSEFTNTDAYELYERFHARPDTTFSRVIAISAKDAQWRQMNVRGYLCAAAHRGLLIRLGPGRYRFPIPKTMSLDAALGIYRRVKT